MEYVRFGNTGLKVSRICVGCMSYGSPEWQPWILNKEKSLALLKKSWDAGINFFDTADVYSNGESERILGCFLKDFNIPREQVVIATKVYFAVSNDDISKKIGWDTREAPSPSVINQAGLSRKHIFEAVEKSLERLGTSYIDLYQIHRFDYNTPIEETMEALNDLVRSGKVRYIGASSMFAWQFAKCNAIAEKNGWAKEEEREMIPLLKDQGIAMIPWSPLARGMLSGKKKGVTLRSTTDHGREMWFPHLNIQDQEIIDRVVKVASRLTVDSQGKTQISPSIVALAWILSKGYVTSPIVGMGKEEYLEDALNALKLKLTIEDIDFLESAYHPKPIAGHS
ncbi:hypothetical protein HK096_005554 [Nowakowskiella sp. JEL0078]|nr:hypothetical protein HK096_005554 [Nowakowskiella sp. JEL0078]